jgi:hypothetical protein
MYKRICLSALLIFWPALEWSVNATGFTVTKPCRSPPFGAGAMDMHLHLVHFPKQKPGQELVLMMPSMLGPSGVTDWADVVGSSAAHRNAVTARMRRAHEFAS